MRNAVFVVCGAMCGVTAIGCRPADRPVTSVPATSPAPRLPASIPGPAPATTPAAKRWTRDEFRALVMGKTKDEVIAAVGKPDKTQEDRTAEYWYYDKRTYDPVAEKNDNRVQVVFKDGIVTGVNF